MSKLVYSFLKDSFLFNDSFIANSYFKISEKELEKELENYRNFILKNINTLYEEVTINTNQIKIFNIDNSIDLLKIKQMSFYLDQVIITDSLFEMTTPINSVQNTFSEYLGVQNKTIDRKELVETIQKFKNAEVLVDATYLKFFPTSYFFELKSEIPISYSETQYSDILPINLMEFYYKNTQVRSFEKNGQYLTLNKNFERDRTIEILFKNDNTKFTNMYNLLEQEIINYDENTKIAKIAMILPNTKPSKESFNTWVNQSINQSIVSHFNKISNDINLSIKLKAQYVTTSSFVDELLKNQFNLQPDIKSNISNMMLNFDLKFFENIDIRDLMSIRKNDGEEFEVFRRELEKQLRGLRNEQDVSKIKSKIEDVKHELEEVQIAAINSKFKKIKKSSSINASIGVAGLGASFLTSGFSTFATLISLFNGYKNYTEYQNEIKENPSYFLWKIKKNENN